MSARGTEEGLGETLARLADRSGRLVQQHLALAKAEVTHEVTTRGGRLLRAVVLGLVGGVVTALSLAAFVGLALEPWLGRAAQGTALLLVGGGLLFAAWSAARAIGSTTRVKEAASVTTLERRAG